MTCSSLISCTWVVGGWGLLSQVENYLYCTVRYHVKYILYTGLDVCAVNEPHFLSLINKQTRDVKSPTVPDVFQPLPGFNSYAGVTGRWGLLSHVHNTVMWHDITHSACTIASCTHMTYCDTHICTHTLGLPRYIICRYVMTLSSLDMIHDISQVYIKQYAFA